MSNKEIKEAIKLEVERYNKAIDLQTESLNYIKDNYPILLNFALEIAKTAELIKEKELLLDSLHLSLDISNKALANR